MALSFVRTSEAIHEQSEDINRGVDMITDLISEIYGKQKANEVVVGGVLASIFSMGIIYIANLVPAT